MNECSEEEIKQAAEEKREQIAKMLIGTDVMEWKKQQAVEAAELRKIVVDEISIINFGDKAYKELLKEIHKIVDRDT